MCANNGNWTGENNTICKGNSLFHCSTSVPVGFSDAMIYCNQNSKVEMFFAFTRLLQRHRKSPQVRSTCTASAPRNRGFKIIFHRHHLFSFLINHQSIVYCFLQIFLLRRFMAHAPVKWYFTLIHVTTVLHCHGAIQ